jgi:hypothetical protein
MSEGLPIVDLTQLIMKQEKVGWSKAMWIAMQRKEAAEQRRQAEAERARERRQRGRGE